MAPAPPTGRERMVRLRLMLVSLGVGLWALVIVGRLLHLQVLERPFFQRQSQRQSERTITLDPRRGSILDRKGRPLAVSVDAESIYAVPQDVTHPARTAAALARALGADAAGRRDILTQLNKPRAFVWIRRKVSPAAARAVRDLQLDGIGFLTESRRYYPNRELASQVLGYVGLDNEGMSGLEYAFEDALKGRKETAVVTTDARRRPVSHTEKRPTEGQTLVLTLDEPIQHAAERELERAMAETQAQSGVVVVVDPWTGEVLAMANRPTFNPNAFQNYSASRWRNRAVADAYEPGSMFKIITAAAGLQERVVEPDETLDCGMGGMEVAGIRINDHAVFDKLSFRQVIAKSSNVGVARVAQRLGREQFDRYLREFGFGAATGVGLPGESQGLLRPTSKWSATSLACLAFGHEVGVTALQMAMAASAVANGGYLMRPLVARQIEDADGSVARAFSPVAVRRVLQPETTATLTELLKEVVREGGTGKRAQVAGYAVAGKTGTAQKIDASGRYSSVDHVSSFVGFVPASHPALVILVSLDTPRGARNEGGDVAAPVFARVAERALRHLAVPPDDPDRVLRVAPFRPEVVAAASRRPVALPVHASLASAPDDPRRMPDLRGSSAREAAIAAARRGLIVELKGSGQVVEQAPEPGAEIEAGQTCTLTLSLGSARPAAAAGIDAEAGPPAVGEGRP
jgi:cell division protein FtsI (penicillin-binding protein 3)